MLEHAYLPPGVRQTLGGDDEIVPITLRSLSQSRHAMSFVIEPG